MIQFNQTNDGLGHTGALTGSPTAYAPSGHGGGTSNSFVRDLLASAPDDEITDLEVRRASLEDTYLAMVQRFESGDMSEAATAFSKGSDGS